MGTPDSESALTARRRKRPQGARRTKLTKLEREIYELRNQDYPPAWAELSRRMGKDRRTLQRTYERAEAKLPKEGQLEPPPNSLQVRDPEKYAQVVEELSAADGAGLTAAAIAKRLNLPRQTADAVAHEIQSIYFPTKIEARNVKLERLNNLWGMRAEEALGQLTPERMANASPKDLAIIAAIATEKLLLLRGQPTQIVRTEEDRTKVDVLARAFIAEAEKRGYEVKTDAASGEVDLVYTRAGVSDG